MLNKWVKRFETDAHWAFVSVVRDPGQIEMFDKLLEENGRTLDSFVHFTLSEEHAIERMSLRRICPYCDTTYHIKYKREKVEGYCDRCGMKLVQREDDLPEKIALRLKEYNRTISPILETYKERGILIEIDATPSIEEIHTQVVAKLGL
jgi:adenylate kinase